MRIRLGQDGNSKSDRSARIRALLLKPELLRDVAEEAVLDKHGNYNEDTKKAAHMAADAVTGYLIAQLAEA